MYNKFPLNRVIQLRTKKWALNPASWLRIKLWAGAITVMEFYSESIDFHTLMNILKGLLGSLLIMIAMGFDIHYLSLGGVSLNLTWNLS